MKKSGFKLFLFSLLPVFLSSFVSAQSSEFLNDVSVFFQNLVAQILGPLFLAVLGGTNSSKPLGNIPQSELIIAKALFFLLLLVIIWVLISRVGFLRDRNFVVGIISAIVSVLSVRYIFDPSLIYTIILPYTALGIALTSIIPFVLYVYFVQSVITTKIGRKIAYVFMAVVFFVLFFSRLSLVGGRAHWIYGVTVLLSLALLWFDGTLQRIRGLASKERAMQPAQSMAYHKLLDEREEVNGVYLSALRRGDDTRANHLKGRLDNIDRAINQLLS